MTDSLRYQSVSRGPITYIRLYGVIDESLNPAELAAEATGSEIIINLKAITRLSSFGVREWIRAVEGLGAHANKLYLVECAPPVVAQLNMIANFAGPAQVVSVQVPYYCDNCGWDTTVTFELSQPAGPQLQLPCRACSHPMEMDDDPASYLAFRSGQSPLSLDPSVASFIQSFAESAPDPNAPAPAAPGGNSPDPGRTQKPWERYRLPVIAGAAAVALAVLVGVLASGRGDGIPADKLAVYQGYLSSDQFEQARALVAELHQARRIPESLKINLETDIAQRQAQRVQELQRQINQRFREKAYLQVLQELDQLEALLTPLDADSVFLKAEALRKLNRLKEAKPHYQRFNEEMAKARPADKRRDDSLYWLAEAAAEEQDADTAAQLYQRVIDEFPGSNYRRSAQRKLRQYKP